MHACLIMSCVNMSVHICVSVCLCVCVCVYLCVCLFTCLCMCGMSAAHAGRSGQPGSDIDISSNVEQNKSSLKSFPFGKGSVLRELMPWCGLQCI